MLGCPHLEGLADLLTVEYQCMAMPDQYKKISSFQGSIYINAEMRSGQL